MIKFLKLTFHGLSIGILIGYLIALIESLINNSNYFYPSSPGFVNNFHSNTIATLFSTILWAGIGLLFSYSSIIFDSEKLSITDQTILHFIITYIIFTLLACFSGWFPLTLPFFISYTITFIITYIITWFVSMKIAKAKIKIINNKLNQKKIE